MKGLAWLALAFVAVQGGRTFFVAKDRSLAIYNYSTGEGGLNEKGEFVFDVKGNPLKVESHLQGLTITGLAMNGSLGSAPDPKDPKRTVTMVKSLLATGNPVVQFDSVAQYNALVARAETFKLEAPPLPKSKDTGELRTAELSYTGSATEGTFDIAQPFTLKIDSEGKTLVEVKGKAGEKPQQVEKSFTIAATVTGSSSTIHLDPSAIGKKQLQKGEVKGPIVLHMEQKETIAPATVPVVTIMDGQADRMDFDLKETYTITLTGNVKVAYTGEAYKGTSEGDKAIITLDPETLKPIKYRITGDPTKMVARKKGGIR